MDVERMPGMPHDENTPADASAQLGFLLVSAGFQALAGVLHDFTSRRMPEVHPSGEAWLEKVTDKMPFRYEAATEDIRFQLEVLRIQWGPLFGNDRTPARSAIDELIPLRNRWAHTALTQQDVGRALDAMRDVARQVDAEDRLEAALDFTGASGPQRVQQVESYLQSAFDGAPSEGARRAKEAVDGLRESLGEDLSLEVKAFQALPGRVRASDSAERLTSALARRDRKRWTVGAIEGPLVATEDEVVIDSRLLVMQLAAVGLRQTFRPNAHELHTLRLSLALLMISEPSVALDLVTAYVRGVINELVKGGRESEHWCLFMATKAAEAAYSGVPTTLATAGPDNTPVLGAIVEALPKVLSFDPNALPSLVAEARRDPLRMSDCLVWWQLKTHQYLGAMSPEEIRQGVVQRRWFADAVQGAATKMVEVMHELDDPTWPISSAGTLRIAEVLGCQGIDLQRTAAAGGHQSD